MISFSIIPAKPVFETSNVRSAKRCVMLPCALRKGKPGRFKSRAKILQTFSARRSSKASWRCVRACPVSSNLFGSSESADRLFAAVFDSSAEETASSARVFAIWPALTRKPGFEPASNRRDGEHAGGCAAAFGRIGWEEDRPDRDASTQESRPPSPRVARKHRKGCAFCRTVRPVDHRVCGW